MIGGAKDACAGRVAIVTGGGRGMGRAMALGLARAGMQVIITAAHERAEIEAVAATAREEMGEARIIAQLADVTRSEDCAHVVQIARKRFGRLDVLVNNAGRGMKYVSPEFLTKSPHFWEVDPEIWRMVIDTNVNGPFLMARAAVPVMLAAGWGRVINISMHRETMRRQGFSPYGPSKAALEAETAIWAQDLADTGVTVNALLPGGATLTGMIPAGVDDHIRAGLLPPEIMVPPLLWLVSPAADGFTGKRLIAKHWRAAPDSALPPHEAMDAAGW